MNITTSITLNMQTPGYVVAYEPQGNKLSRFITATLKDGSASWSVPSGATAMIRVAKPDGTFAVYDKNEKGQTAYTISGSTVTIELVGAALAAAGDALVTVMFLDSTGSNLSPFSFRLVIMPSAVSDDDIASSDYFNVFQDTINQLQAFYGAPLTAATASAMTDTTRVYVYVGSESGYVYGHWYYYNGSTWVNGGVYNSEGINSNWLYAAYPVETISNAVLAHFNDGADDVPVKTLRLAINPVQSGTGDPSPDNVRPISGWTAAEVTRTGKNLLPFPYVGTVTNPGTYSFSGVTVTVNSDGTMLLNGTASANIYMNLTFDSITAVPVPPVGTLLTIGCEGLVAGITFINGIFTSPDLSTRRGFANLTDVRPIVSGLAIADGDYYFRSYIQINNGTVCNNVLIKPFFTVGNTPDATFEPYKGTTYEVSFSTAGTVYGGILTYNGDGTWTLTVKWFGLCFDTAEKIALLSTYTDRRLEIRESSLMSYIPYPRIKSASTQLCSHATYQSNAGTIHQDTIAEAQFQIYPTNGRIYFAIPGVDSLQGYKDFATAQMTAGTPLTFVSLVAESQYATYQLTGPEVLTLLGINNLWADTGDIEELAYRADIGLYLVEALNPIKEMLAYREDTMRATRAYATGDYIVVGDTFFKVTVPIANGATLTPNTNVIKTTVGDQLKALS